MEVDDLEEELLPSPLFYPQLSGSCLEHECYLSDSEESMDSTCMFMKWLHCTSVYVIPIHRICNF